MKAIFSKSGHKKDISSKMDRRTTANANANVSFSAPNHAVVSPNTGRVNSFIPTPASYHQGHGHGQPGKQMSQSSVVPLQQQISQQQQQTQLSHSNHFYSNIPGNSNANGGGVGSVPRGDHHYTNYQQQSIHQSQQQIHSRTLTKSYSSSHNQNHNQQSHYGNTTLYANASNSNANHSHGAFYGNTTNLANGAMIMNSGHHGGGGGEKILVNGHHASEVMGQVHNVQQSTYNHEQIVHHQQMQTNQSIQKLQVVQPTQQNNQRVHHNKQPQPNFQQQQHNHHHHNANVPNSTEGLPPTLVESMRTLFDILDDSKQGKIRLSDIETRWESDSNNGSANGKAPTGAEPLIKMGVLQYLRKVTPGDGMLTFDRFCSGLRLALLTNNGEHSDGHAVTMQSEKVIQRTTNPPPQHYFQEQVRNMTNVAKPIHNQIGPPPPPQLPSQPMFNGNSVPPNKSTSVLPGTAPGQNNTISRLSKIPNFSTSRLPMLNTGIPLSPTNRANTIPMTNNNKSNNGGQSHSHHNHNGTLISGTKRYPNNSEQNTTVVLVHPQPPPNPKPTGGPNNFTLNSTNTYSAVGGTNKSNSGFLNRFSSKNSSLDDLQVPNDESLQQSNSVPKDRPPSAPILDASDQPKKLPESQQQLTKQKIRERAKSQERDRSVVKNGNSHVSRAEEKSNFVKSRQRTLSMPQLQLNKLKPQPTVNFDESSGDKMDPSPVENYPRPSTLKNHSLSKLLASGHQYSGSSIPTMASTNPSTNTLKHSKEEDEMSKQDKDNKDFPPPPPKPPRNGDRNTMSGPVTISTTLINTLTADPPLSGSSFGSGQSSSATISVSTTSSSAGVQGNPEIRHVLNSWQKGLTDKKPVKPSLSAASIGTNSSVNTVTTNETSKSASVLQNGVTKMTNGITSDDVKLRQPTKSNLKRKETARRHTVQSGIDFSTLKRLKQLEQERDVLQQGVQYLEKANEWYMKQLETSNDKITLLGKGAPTSDYWSESHEERLNLLGCRITEVNGLLTALMDGSSQLPLHMNLQIPSHLSLRTITRLKDQNRQLTLEVSDYSHRVTQLENEKAMLLRQLFHQKNKSASDETVYM